MTSYAPGTVAQVRCRNEERQAMSSVDGKWWFLDHGTYADKDEIEVIRELCVVDPSKQVVIEASEDGCRAFFDQLNKLHYERKRMPGSGIWFADVLDAFRSLLTPPKPEEPQGLGAVVEDADAMKWVAGPGNPGGKRWEPETGGEPQYYRDLSAVRVLSVGIGEAE